MTVPLSDPRVLARADIQAVDRISQILGLFTDDRTRLTTNAVAESLSLSRSTAHRYLSSMTAEDLLEPCTDPAGYRLGSLILRLGGLTIGQGRIVTIAAEPMAQLATAVGTTVSLSLWTSAGPVVARVQEPPRRNVVLTVRVGTMLAADSAQAVLFLAFRQDTEGMDQAIQALPEPRRSITMAKAGEARRTQIATTIREENGTWSTAAPVFDGTGICASLAIIDTINTMSNATSNATFPHRIGQLQDTAQNLSHRLGGHIPVLRR